jgi:hypothetical protein
MKVGFVGTPRGLTEAQRDTVRALLQLSGATELHHGDCTGAAGQAVAIAAELGLRIVSHPAAHAPRTPCESDEARPVRPSAQRDADIVSSTDLLIASPDGEDPRRSNVWRTVRLACGAPDASPHLVVLPDGSLACGPTDTLACFLARDATILGLARRAEPLDATGTRCLAHKCC